MGIGVQVNIARQRPAFFDGKMVTCADITQIEDISLGTPNDKAHSLVIRWDSPVGYIILLPCPGAASVLGQSSPFLGSKKFIPQPSRSYSRELRARYRVPT